MKTGNDKNVVFGIGGMTCVNCQNRIEKKLKNTAGIREVLVSYVNGTASVTCNESVISRREIIRVIEALGYRVLEEGGRKPLPAAARAAGALIVVFALYALLRRSGVAGFAAVPLAQAGMGYGMLFVIGLVTSLHCAAMCGGINLSQCLPGAAGERPARAAALVPAVLYNSGRVVSYTVVGIIVGAAGSVLTVSGRFQGILQLAAGVFMVIMGINMLGIFPALRRFSLHMPKIFTRKNDGQNRGGGRPLVVGLLNGLMPCGPLQAMQLYALSTGSPIAGGVSMFLFSMGTVPFMFGIGALSSLLTNAPALTAKAAKAGAVLVAVLGLTMFSNGWSLAGFHFNFADSITAIFAPDGPAVSRRNAAAAAAGSLPVIENGVQTVNSALSGGRYPAITVQRGIPVKWIINAPQGSINGCNNRMIIREYGIEHRFTPGENVIEFNPEKAGRFPYSCWMGMIRSSITVVAEGAAADAAGAGPGPVPAGVLIPTDRIALAEVAGNFQAVKINLRDDGIDPAVIVVQKGIQVEWTINNDSLDPGNSGLVFPAYYSRFNMEQGDNVIRFIPAGDFDFSTADNVFYGFVKTVDDLGSVDIEEIRTEVSGHETMVYPEAYFEDTASAAGGCCGAVS
ncbi:MAG: sulfite exporter TauE/SafE family protein [Treponema sp.]|jgi:sulfite exporter TauE/SafE/copper chaperone CopZ/plastocyanin domain-containing protein|nr:sulfite exporter TauE/SafE family protein [Treponema sp.]